MPQFEGASFPSQLLWMAIAFAALYVFMRRVALPRIGAILEQRHGRIRADLDRAQSLKSEAEKVREAYEAALAEGRGRAQQLIREAAAAAAEATAAKQQELGAKIEQEIDAAEKRIDRARNDALKNVRAVAVEAAREATARLIDVEVDKKAAGAAVDDAIKGRG